MGDVPETPAPVTPPTGAIVPAREVDREQFIDTFTVREKGRRYEVAANAIANKAMMQVNVAKLRVLAERAMEPYLANPDMPVTPKELKIMTEAIDLIDNMGANAYSDSKGGGMLANSLERLVHAAARGAASGASGMPSPEAHSPEARMKRLNSIGRKKAEKEIITELEEDK